MHEQFPFTTAWYVSTRCRVLILRNTTNTPVFFKSFIFTDSAHAKRVCATEEAGYFYSRVSNVGRRLWQ